MEPEEAPEKTSPSDAATPASDLFELEADAGGGAERLRLDLYRVADAWPHGPYRDILRSDETDPELNLAAASGNTGGATPGGRVGALIRMGRNISEPRPQAERGGWYMFAGADAQAFTWRLGEGRTAAAAGVRFEEIAMNGDAQAGVALRLDAGDLTLGMIHREVSHAGASADQQFGGVSFVISR